jgi:hypothetical protein
MIKGVNGPGGLDLACEYGDEIIPPLSGVWPLRGHWFARAPVACLSQFWRFLARIAITFIPTIVLREQFYHYLIQNVGIWITQDISEWIKLPEIAYKWGILANVGLSNKLTSTKLLVAQLNL